jgi:hypothetical protein
MSLEYYRDGMVGHGVAKIDGGEKIQRALLRKQKKQDKREGGQKETRKEEGNSRVWLVSLAVGISSNQEGRERRRE